MTTGALHKEEATIRDGPPLPRRVQARVLVPFTVVTLIWSSTWLVIRDELDAVSPAWSIAYRFTIAGAAMLAYAIAMRSRLRLTRVELVWAGTIGLAQYVLNYGFVYAAEVHIASGLVALLFALLIVPNAILGWLFLGERLSRRFLLGAGIAVLGLALLFGHEWRGAAARPHAVLLGVGFTLLATLAASVANVMSAAPRVRAVPMPTLVGSGMIAGAVVDIAYAAATAGPPRFDLGGGYWLATCYLALVASTLAFPLYYHVIRTIGSARAAYSSLLTPFLAMALSTVFEGYRWSAQAAVGCLLAILGLFVALRARIA